MKILITGNMGYVGPVVINHFKTVFPQSELFGFDAGYFGNSITNPDVLPENKLTAQYFGDIRSFPNSILEGIDVIIHLAAISNDPIGNKFEKVTLDINHKSSINLAREAKKAGVRTFVFASSCSIYGAASDDERTEKSQLNPLTAYAKSKVYTEQDLEPLADDSFNITCLRFSTACGMSNRLRLDLVLNDFVAAAISSKKILILSDGTPWRPLINVRDMALAFEWAIRRQLSQGGRFLAVNIGSSQWNYQVSELAEAVAGIIPNTEVSINKDAQPDKRSYRVNFDLFKELAPMHQPQNDLVSTIAQLKDGLEKFDFHDPDFRNSHLIRLNVLDHLQEQGFLDSDLRWKF